MIVRGAALAGTMSTHLLDRIEHEQLISVETNTVIRDVRGHRQLESVVTENGAFCSGAFTAAVTWQNSCDVSGGSAPWMGRN